MSLSIQTNTDSLIAQENLLTNSNFQSNTIQQLTSGYRINTAGDDPAGLAVANKYASAIAELTQGVANGNDATAQLQIMDGGMSNISQIVNTLQTLATESASTSFTGSRTTLNEQFQSDLAEIDRQAQSIGLNTGGTFAQQMAVYLGVGSGSQSTANGVVNVDLSNATVDTQSLGLSGQQAVNLGATVSDDYDLGPSSTSSVADIVNDTVNDTRQANGDTQFVFTGPGFGDASGIAVNVSLTGVDSTASLVSAINSAITAAGNGATSGAAAAFKAANITASIHTDSQGNQQLAFTSSHSAFQVTAGDVAANAFMGFLADPGVTDLGDAVAANTNLISGGSYMLGTPASGSTPAAEADVEFTTNAAAANQAVTFTATDASGVAHSTTINVATKPASLTALLTQINTALQATNDSTLQQITAVQGTQGASDINFISSGNFSVSLGTTPAASKGLYTASDTGGGVTLSSYQVGAGGTADISTVAGAQAAVTAITNAVAALGVAQAAVGTGENQLSFASSLAQSQITNFSSAESQIRDANIAEEAANLSKAQVLQQSSIAAMAQANAEPQALLTLLKQ
ncbi:MAG: flagellin [Bryobacteraceae bacterium]